MAASDPSVYNGRMGRFALFAALATALAGCGDRAETRKADAHVATPDASSAACESDRDCTDGWTPSANGCGSPDRCMEDRCVEPPAMTGVANAETGAIAFDTPGGERRFQVEVVQEGFETQRGLMCRSTMQDDWGMVFLFARPKRQSFWMKNTLIPLDMVFLDADWKVVGVVANAQPQTLTGRGVDTPSQYVLELVTGAAAKAGIAPGVPARFYPPRR